MPWVERRWPTEFRNRASGASRYPSTDSEVSALAVDGWLRREEREVRSASVAENPGAVVVGTVVGHIKG